MINYKQWQLLHESFGTFPLGIKSPSNLGLVSPYHTDAMDEMGMNPPGQMQRYMDDDENPFAKKKPHPDMGGGGDDMGGEDMGGDEEMDHDHPDDMGDEDDMGGDEEGEMTPCPDCNPDGDGEGDPSCETCGGTGEVPSDDDDSGEDDSIDPDAEFDDDDMGGDEMGGDDMGGDGDDDDMGMPMKKKPPMGEPHKSGPFMQFQKRMKAEAKCHDDDKDDDKDEDDDSDDDGKFNFKKKKKEKDSDGDVEKGDKLSFLQKKSMKKKMSSGDTAAKEGKIGKVSLGGGKAAPKGNPGVAKGTPPNQKYDVVKKISKKCGSGDMEKMGNGKMCGKCNKQKKTMKEANADYGRPKDFDPSEQAFVDSMKRMYGNPSEKFSDGLRDFSEDMLLPTPPPQPGEAGYAPQTRVGSDAGSMSESITHLMKKITELENKLKKSK